MKTIDAGLAIIVDGEGFSLTAYPDPYSDLGKACRARRLPLARFREVPGWQRMKADPWTIGVGATGHAIGPDTIWTRDQAWNRFDQDVAECEREVAAAVKVPLNENQFSALISWVFNLGIEELLHGGDEDGSPSGLLRKLNAGNYLAAANEFPRWIYSNGERSSGLLTRRLRERQLFLTPPVPKKTSAA